MPRLFVVTNFAGANVRSKPDTNTGAILRTLFNGEPFEVLDTNPLSNQVWARLASAKLEYVCVSIGSKVLAREQTSDGKPISLEAWQKAIDAWARLRGFDGPNP